MKIAEVTGIKPIKPLTPDQAKIDSLQKQKDAAADRLKQERVGRSGKRRSSSLPA